MQQQDIQVIKRINNFNKLYLKKKTLLKVSQTQLSHRLPCYCCLLDKEGSSFIGLLHSIFLHCWNALHKIETRTSLCQLLFLFFILRVSMGITSWETLRCSSLRRDLAGVASWMRAMFGSSWWCFTASPTKTQLAAFQGSAQGESSSLGELCTMEGEQTCTPGWLSCL